MNHDRNGLFDHASQVVANLGQALNSEDYREDVAMSPDAVRQAGPFLTTLLSAFDDSSDAELARRQLRNLLALCD